MVGDPRALRAAGMGRGFGNPDNEREMPLRERHKVDKLQRISAAAIERFGREGYESATLRDIARDAGVALGTLSLYARDKRDLVLMIFNRVIPPLVEMGRRSTVPTAPLVDNVINFFSPFYTAYAQNATLYRVVLSQIHTAAASVHAQENEALRTDLLGHLRDILLRAAASGHCRRDIDPEIQARTFFYLYFASVRVWLFQKDPDPAQGLAELRTLYEQHVEGIRPQP